MADGKDGYRGRILHKQVGRRCGGVGEGAKESIGLPEHFQGASQEKGDAGGLEERWWRCERDNLDEGIAD